MRLLATAKPNKRYVWYRNLISVKLEAYLCNNKVIYYEIWNSKERRISEAAVKNMFRPGYSIKDRPFLIRKNQDFYAILNRQLINYFPKYKELKNKGINHTFVKNGKQKNSIPDAKSVRGACDKD